MTIRVMVVDDSAVVRKVLTEMLNAASGIAVVCSAQDPIFAQAKLEVDWPDVIVLDVEMPRMDGLTFLKKIMAQRPTPVVMCSTLTGEGTRISLQALSAGAVDVIEKPKTNLNKNLPEAAKDLIHAVRAAAKAKMSRVRTKPSSSAAVAPAPVKKKLSADAVLSAQRTGPLLAGKMVAIGTSTGGTQALEEVLPKLPANSPPIVIVQHMPEAFTGPFASRLNQISTINVVEATDGEVLQQGKAIIANGGKHMMVERGATGFVVRVKDGPAVSRHKPSVDVLFRSISKCSKDALGIILTGMGDDGAAGLLEMREHGLATLGQDEASCVVYGMPAAAMKRGAVERQVSLGAVSNEVVRYASST